MDAKLIDKTFARYNRQSLWTIVALTLVILVVQNVFYLSPSVIHMVAVSVVYTLITTLAYGVSWRSIAKSSPNTLSKFYIAAPAFRMMIGVLVVLAYCLAVRERTLILTFTVVFFAYYVIMLVFDGAFFAQVEKSNNKNK